MTVTTNKARADLGPVPPTGIGAADTPSEARSPQWEAGERVSNIEHKETVTISKVDLELVLGLAELIEDKDEEEDEACAHLRLAYNNGRDYS